MATRIVTKSGSGAPTTDDLIAGELAVDLTNKRLYTENSGGTVLELGTNPASDVTFGDNTKAIFGAGSDLQIYHDGSNSIIEDIGTGYLDIKTNGAYILLRNTDGNNLAYFETGGGSHLYWNGASGLGRKLQTTATGIDVTGTVTADGLTVDGDGLLYSASNVEMRGDANVRISLGTAGTSGANNNSNWIYGNGTNLRFNNAGGFYSWETLGTERMRIDASGNLLVGKTAVNTTVAGAEIRPNLTAITSAGDAPLYLIRNTNDGDIITMKKDGATVGSIGNNTDFFVASADGTGLRFSATQVLPCSESGATQNGSRDLGSSGARFQDLFIGNDIAHLDASGTARLLYDKSVNLLGNAGTNVEAYNLNVNNGIIFGTTGGAVTGKTLDDYEEGTFTPITLGSTTAGTGTYGFQHGSYTKVGNLVTVNIYVDTTSHTGAGSLRVGGLPFTVQSGSDQYAVVSFGELVNVTKTADTIISGYTLPTTTTIAISQITTGTTEATTSVLPMDGLARFLLTVTYQT